MDFHYVGPDGNKHAVTTVEEEEFPQFYHSRSARRPEQPQSDEDGASQTSNGGSSAADGKDKPGPQAASNPEPKAKEGHAVFAENRKGVSFAQLFGPYLDGATQIKITDPYIRLFYQVRNVMELVELIVQRKAPEDQVSVELVTGPDDGNIAKQRENLDSIVEACRGSGVDFKWSFDGGGTAHARHIITDTGWKISLDRGLDIFQHYPMNDAFSLANRLQEHRAIKQFEITYIRETKAPL